MAVIPLRIDDPADPRIAGFVSIKERDLTGRHGRFIAEGTVVLRMLAAAHRAGRGIEAEAILLLENRVDGLSDILAEFPADIPVYVANAAVFDAIAGFNMHRGVLAIGRRGSAPEMDALVGGFARQQPGSGRLRHLQPRQYGFDVPQCRSLRR